MLSLFVDFIFSYLVFFFKQKTAYEMRISDWSSDVCSSDLPPLPDALDTLGHRPAAAFVPPGRSREILDFHAVTSGGQWAIAELALASIKERQKRANPWELKVCPGPLCQPSEFQDDWQVDRQSVVYG